MPDVGVLTAWLRRLDDEVADRDPDFRAPRALAAARALADRLLVRSRDADLLWRLEQACSPSGRRDGFSRVTLLAVKLARSRALLLDDAHGPLVVSVVVPAYDETTRLKPRGDGPGQDPHGEDFAVQKSAQLEWLFAGTGSSYRVHVVDDMSKPSPETGLSSGAAIAAVVAEHGLPGIEVLSLTDGVLREKDAETLVGASLRRVGIPKDTRKAGAVYYGAATAIQAHGTGAEHVVVITDCDLSVDLGQVGNLVAPIVTGDAAAVAGSRRLPESLLEIEPGRNTRANAARYFRQLLLPGLLPRDTQCGAKAFAAGALARVIGDGLEVMDFSFDIELLTRMALAFGADRVVAVPVAWFDSSELTTTDSSVHFGIMRTQLAIARRHRTGSGEDFDRAVQVSQKLTADEQAWLAFLDRLAADSRLLRGIERFDTALLPELDRLAAGRPT